MDSKRCRGDRIFLKHFDNLINFLQSTSGADWKVKSAEFISWIGLDKTLEFQNYAQDLGYFNPYGSNKNFHASIKDAFKSLAQNNCN